MLDLNRMYAVKNKEIRHHHMSLICLYKRKIKKNDN